jgi:N-acetylneuraminic acid mutarotase
MRKMTSPLVRFSPGFARALLLAGVAPAAPALAGNSGTWATTGSLNAGRMAATLTALPNGQVLAAGGANYNWAPLATAELYNPATGKWTLTGRLHTARYYATATLLSNGQVLVAGGDGPARPLASAELYTPAAGTWTVTGSMRTARYAHATVLLPNGEVMAVGGENATGYTPTAEL